MLLNCAAKRSTAGRVFAAASRLGPTCSSRCVASALVRPCADVSSAARTSERPTACESVSTASVVVTVETSQTVVALAAP
ncbi:Uncharacterised protein [Mycobacteroides abscessus subsp. abscessus]|nr:Uncharacterised protein [Mycobacteroides abscessus subsp. abscessus]